MKPLNSMLPSRAQCRLVRLHRAVRAPACHRRLPGNRRPIRRRDQMDLQIGRVLHALDANGVSENMIVIFTSDNGGERYADTWPFTGRKSELLDGGLCIPAVIRWPGHIRQGSVSEQVMIGMDWLPTLLAAAGTTPDPAYPPRRH